MSSPSQDPAKSQLVSLADEEAVKEILVTTIRASGTSSTISTRLRPSKRERYRVTIFGSARADLGHSSTTRSSGLRPRSPRWAATSSPAADPG